MSAELLIASSSPHSVGFEMRSFPCPKGTPNNPTVKPETLSPGIVPIRLGGKKPKCFFAMFKSFLGASLMGLVCVKSAYFMNFSGCKITLTIFAKFRAVFHKV